MTDEIPRKMVGSCLKSCSVWLVLFHLHSVLPVIIPGVNPYWYQQPGQLNIGVMVDLHDFSNEDYCSTRVYELSVARVEAVLYALNKINEDPNLLPSLSLGVMVCDSCMKDTTSLACAIRLTTENHTYRGGTARIHVDTHRLS